mmetsp:Transcript_5241/g.4832  ORF Transcript_5241/g.4832 Transcript_5241/m.4832 type:complete len:161 (+) Transcript_5241:1521-2003(+)
MIQEDPKQHMFSPDSKYHIVNRPNSLKQTPLYVAAKHGHLDMVKFLLSRGANPHILSFVSSMEQESVLEVSARWNHLQIVEHLLTVVDWTRQELKQALKSILNQQNQSELKRKLEEYARRKFGKCYAAVALSRCFLLCFSSQTPDSRVNPELDINQVNPV